MVRVFRLTSAIVFLAAFAFVSLPVTASTRTQNDYILVLDTSYSMVGKGGRDIFAEVKKSLDGYIDKIQKGDSLTFITFDSGVKIYPTVSIEGQNGRDIVKKYLSMLESKGEWTYTVEMLRSVIRTAADLQAKDATRQQVIVIMTDAQDDPPPAKRKDIINIKELAKANQGNDWFIYLLDTGDITKNPKLAKLRGDLAAVSKYTQVVDTNAGIADAVKKVSDDAAKKSAEIHRPFFLNPFFLAGLLVVIALLVIWYLLRLSKLKLNGTLEFWSNDTFHKDILTADLSTFNMRKLAVGKDGDVRIRLKDFTSRIPVILEAASFGGRIRPMIVEALSAPVEFVNKKTSFLTDGDTFKAGSYTFIYHEKK